MEEIVKSDLAKKYFPIYKYGYHFRLVGIDDAEFILSLRNNPILSFHLSETSNQLTDQIDWIQKYKEREKQGLEFYIICIGTKTNKKLGLNRLYNITSHEFEIGSWLYEPGLEISTSIIGDIVARSFAFEVLECTSCVFNVRKANKSVLKYHLSYKPEIVDENDINFHFRLTEENFTIHKNKLLKILGHD